mgnify:CR=1 FL=1
MTRITVAKGDGIGPEIMDATLEIIKAAGAKIEIDENGVRTKIKGIVRDITKYIEQEVKLEIASRNFKVSFENSPVPMILQAEDGEFLLMNKACLDLTGYEFEELNSLTKWMGKIHRERKDFNLEFVKKAFYEGVKITGLKEDIYTGNCFEVKWLKQHGLKLSFKNNKLKAKGFMSWLLNTVTPTNASWNGHNASGWKKDIVAINGFDERMQYGGQDRELGERLFNKGLKSKQFGYTAVCVHLDHPRGYKNQESISKNLQIRKTTKTENKVWTDYGIVKK